MNPTANHIAHRGTPFTPSIRLRWTTRVLGITVTLATPAALATMTTLATLATVTSSCLPAGAQEVALPPDAEAGFRRVMQMAQDGELGSDVSNANIGLEPGEAHIELVRPNNPSYHFRLTVKRSRQPYSRYFDIGAAEDVDPSHIARLGAALDRAFTGNPFRMAGLEQSPDFAARPWADAWANDGWRGLVRGTELRMTSLRSFGYTVAVMVALALCAIGCTALLWCSGPIGQSSASSSIRGRRL